MKRREVVLTEHAHSDLEEILDYIAEHDASVKADNVLRRVEAVLETLATRPERGTYPRELVGLGIREFRQVHWKPYRVIYRIEDARVLVYVIADGRRELSVLLERRLLGS